MMLRVGYPTEGEEIQMLESRLSEMTIERRVSPSDVNVLREFIYTTVYVDDKILEYIVRLGRATRDPETAGRPEMRELLQLGISPRSYQHLLALARVNAFLHGRTWVLPVDVKEIFCDAARHRIARTVRAQAEGVDADAMLRPGARCRPMIPERHERAPSRYTAQDFGTSASARKHAARGSPDEHQYRPGTTSADRLERDGADDARSCVTRTRNAR